MRQKGIVTVQDIKQQTIDRNREATRFLEKRYELVQLAVVGGASVLSGIAPTSRVMWFTEMFWAWGLVAILLLAYRQFRFSAAAYSCFFVWCLLQIIGAHWTFEHVPMDWLTAPLGL